jgi:hypothetical protein
MSVQILTKDPPDSWTNLYTQSLSAAIDLQCQPLTTTQINNIIPKTGMLVFNNDITQFEGYYNGSWNVIGSTGGTGTRGPTGPQGVTGSIGPTGPQGAQGVTGAAGSQGTGGSFTGTFTCGGATGTSTVYYSLINNTASIFITNITITQSGVGNVTLTTGIIPSAFLPLGPVIQPCTYIDNSVFNTGIAYIDQTGSYYFTAAGANNFSGTGIVRIEGAVITYIN